MKRINPLPACVPALLALLTTCAPATYDKIKWQDNGITVDGNPAEWSLPLRMYDQESKLNYDLSNDTKNLYLIIRTSDDLAQARIIHAGLTIAIDTAGRQHYPVSVAYPLSSSEVMPAMNVQAEDAASIKTNKGQSLLAIQKNISVSGFRDATNGLLPLNNEQGIRVGISWDKSGTLYYEAVIPFRTFYRETLTGRDTLKPFGFEITLHAMPPMEHPGGIAHEGDDNAGTGGGMQGQGGFTGGMGAMGGMSGGMPGGGPPRGSMGGKSSNNVPAKNTITLKRRLAFRQKPS